jgi:hypothetical protein
MPKPHEAASARALERKRFEAAMLSPPALKLILESASTERIAGVVDSNPRRVRAWLEARELLPEMRRPRRGYYVHGARGAGDQRLR